MGRKKLLDSQKRKRIQLYFMQESIDFIDSHPLKEDYESRQEFLRRIIHFLLLILTEENIKLIDNHPLKKDYESREEFLKKIIIESLTK